MKYLALVLVLFTTGCSVYQDMSPAEKTWQAIHGIDVLQTMNIVDNTCFTEGNPLTSRLIGANPDMENVIAWGVGMSFLHAAVSKEIEHSKLPSWVGSVWQGISIVNSTRSVINNHNEGGRPYPLNIETGCN